MNTQLIFEDCLQYVRALKQECLFCSEKGHQLTHSIPTKLDEQVLMIVSKNRQMIVLPERDGLVKYEFNKGKFEKKDILLTVAPYRNQYYEFSLYGIDLKKLYAFLHSSPETLKLVHEGIDFELALRLRKKFLSASDVIFVIISWEKAPFLLCSQEKRGEEFYRIGDVREILTNNDALSAVRMKYASLPCAMKVLRSGEVQSTPKSKAKSVITSRPTLSKEASVVTLDKPLPELSPEDLTVLSKYGIQMPDASKEESIVLRDNELPALTPEDLTVLGKYGIVMDDGESGLGEDSFQASFVLEESQVPLDKKIPQLGKDERDVLQKYGVQLEEGRSTSSREIRSSFESSSLDELPELNSMDINVLKKYGIALQPENEISQKKPRPAKPVSTEIPKMKLPEPEWEVFKFYGLLFDKDKAYTLKEIQDNFTKALSLGKIRLPVHRNHKVVFQRYQLKLPTVPLSQRALKMVSWIPRRYVFLAVGIIILSYVANITFRMYGNYQAYQTKVEECKVTLSTFVDYKGKVENKITQIKNILQVLEKDFPPTRRYPEADPKIKRNLEGLNGKIQIMDEVTDKAEGLLSEEKVDESILWLASQGEKKDSEVLAKLDKLHFKANRTLTIAKEVHDLRERETKVRTVLRRLRENIVGYSQKVKPLAENLATIRKEYPEKYDFPQPPPEAGNMLADIQNQIPDWEKSLEKIERSMLNDNIIEALSYSTPYLDISAPRYVDLDDMTEIVREVLEACQEKDYHREKKLDIAEFLDRVKGRLARLAEELKLSQDGIVRLKKWGTWQGNEKNKFILEQAENEIIALKEIINQSQELVYQGSYDEAQSKLRQQINASTVLPELRQLKGNIFDSIAITQEIETQNQQANQISSLMQNARSQLLPLQDLATSLREKIIYVRENFVSGNSPSSQEFPVFPEKYKQVYAQASKVNKELSKMLTRVQGKLYEKELNQAISLIKNGQPLIENAETWRDSTKKSLEEVENFIENCEAIIAKKERNEKQKQGQALLTVLKTREDSLEKELLTLAKGLEKLNSFPASLKVSSPKQAKEVYLQAKEEKNILTQALEKNKKLLSKNQFTQAISGLREQVAQDSSLAFLRQARESVFDAIELAENVQKRTEQAQEITQLMQKAREGLLPLQSSLVQLKQRLSFAQESFPQEKNFPLLSPSYEKTLQEAEKVSFDLYRILEEAKQKLQQNTNSEEEEERLLRIAQRSLENSEPLVRQVSLWRPKAQEALESLDKFISQCEKLIENRARRQQRQVALTYIKELQERRDGIKTELAALIRAYQILESFPASLNVPKPLSQVESIKSQVNERLSSLSTSVSEGEKFLREEKLNKALEHLRSQREARRLLPLIKQIKDNILDSIEIAKGLQKQEEQANLVTQLMQSARENLLPLQDVTRLLQQKLKLVQKEYPRSEGFPALSSGIVNVYKNSGTVVVKLSKTLALAKVRVEQKELTLAISKLKESSYLVDNAKTLLPQTERSLSEIEAFIEKNRALAETRKKTLLVNTGLRNIQSYLKDLDDQFSPLERYIEQMQKNVSELLDTRDALEQAQKRLEEGRSLSEELRQVAKKTLQAKERQELDQAIEIVKPHLAGGSLDRNLIADLTKMRYELIDLIRESQALSKHKKDVLEIKDIVQTLSKRLDDLTEVVDQFQAGVSDFEKRFAGRSEFFSLPKHKESLDKAIFQVKELREVIEVGEDYLHSARYDRSRDYMKPYLSDTYYLPSMKILLRNLEETKEKNERILNDPNYREEIKRQKEEKANLAKLHKTWEHSPGAWYDTLAPLMERFRQKEEKLKLAVTEKISSFLINNIRNQIVEMERYPNQIADLEELIYKIEKRGGKIQQYLIKREKEALTLKQKRQSEKTQEYYRSRQINISAEFELNDLSLQIQLLEKDLTSGEGVSKERLKKILRVISPIGEKYQEVYKNVQSELVNIETAVGQD